LAGQFVCATPKENCVEAGVDRGEVDTGIGNDPVDLTVRSSDEAIEARRDPEVDTSHAHRVARTLELIVQPLPVERDFHADGDRLRQRAEEIDDGLQIDGHAPHFGEEHPAGVERAHREVPLVQIQSDVSHRSLRTMFR
jgi:hypothetical protein